MFKKLTLSSLVFSQACFAILTHNSAALAMDNGGPYVERTLGEQIGEEEVIKQLLNEGKVIDVETLPIEKRIRVKALVRDIARLTIERKKLVQFMDGKLISRVKSHSAAISIVVGAAGFFGAALRHDYLNGNNKLSRTAMHGYRGVAISGIGILAFGVLQLIAGDEHQIIVETKFSGLSGEQLNDRLFLYDRDLRERVQSLKIILAN